MFSDKPDAVKRPEAAPSNREFGFVFAVFFLMVALLPLLHGTGVRRWAIVASAIMALLAFAMPGLLTPFSVAWYRLGKLLHKLVSPIALALLFYAVITPVGLVSRLFRPDPLGLRFRRSATSYWVPRTPPGPDPNSFKNPF